MPSACRHESTQELQDDKAFKELSTWTRSVHKRLVPIDELRQAKLFRLSGDHGAVQAGLDTPAWRGEAVRTKKAVMPSQDGPDVRSCSRKLARAEFYGPRWHQKKSSATSDSRGAKAQEINYEALARALAS